MPYTESQKNKILFRRRLDEDKKKNKKPSFWSLLFIGGFFIGSLIYGLAIIFFISCLLCSQIEVWTGWKMGAKGLGVFIPIIAIITIVYFNGVIKWENEKGKEIEKPEYERKTGKGEFSNYFNCQVCKKDFNKKLETEKNLCQKCFVGN